MVDAPHTGADVRVETTPTTPGASWGTDVLVGVTVRLKSREQVDQAFWVVSFTH